MRVTTIIQEKMLINYKVTSMKLTENHQSGMNAMLLFSSSS